ncbi:MAG: regulatory protein RecX [Candidatus Omnitrophota bacterium]
MDENEVKKARFYALKVMNFRPRSVLELRDKLADKGFSPATIEAVTTEFGKKGLLDDTKFARVWIDSRMASNPKGESVLRRELKRKGVAEGVTERILADVNKETSEYDTVKRLAHERMNVLRKVDADTGKRRLFSYLKRRGFGSDTIMRVMHEEFRGIDNES